MAKTGQVERVCRDGGRSKNLELALRARSSGQR